ncbi:MAG TPA: DUF692 family protein [Acidobacteriaceae bacterium]|nr:DUF692 family protein [Acidobacteriaceae bacterium]
MTSAALQSSHPAPRPALATTYEGSGPGLLERIAPLVDYLEIPPDSITRIESSGHSKRTAGRASLRPEVLDELDSVRSHTGVIVHGIGLSIGSFDRWNEAYLQLLDEFFTRFTPLWHSEHLGFTTVDGQDLGTMIALPRSEEMLDLICERVLRIQERYKAPFLMEHIIGLLPDAPGDYTPAAFLNAITARTGCGLILDAYNLECDRYNFGFDIAGFLDELNLDPVREIHLAGGFRHEGFQLDIHSQPTAESTLDLGLGILRRCPNLGVVTYELLKEAVPNLGHDRICAELTRIRKAIASC